MAYASGTIVSSRYRLTRVLGRGGMSVVYEAEDMFRCIPVAVKVIDDELRRDPEVRARFSREGRATKDLPTWFLANVHDVGVAENDAPYIVMDLLHGKDLGFPTV